MSLIDSRRSQPGYGTRIPTFYRSADEDADSENVGMADRWKIGIVEELQVIDDTNELHFCSAEIGRFGFGNWCLRRTLFWTCQILQIILCLAILLGIIVYLIVLEP